LPGLFPAVAAGDDRFWGGSLVCAGSGQGERTYDLFQRYALRHAEKDLLARTYLALDAGMGTPRLAGYFSLATVSVDRAAVARRPELDRLPQFPIPGVLLARLAVDTRVRGQGLGRYRFEEALGLMLQLAQAGPGGLPVVRYRRPRCRSRAVLPIFWPRAVGRRFPLPEGCSTSVPCLPAGPRPDPHSGQIADLTPSHLVGRQGLLSWRLC